jgi:hypothetical protein
MSETLRKLAELMRQENTLRKEATRKKCAQIVTAATGLDVLRRKLGAA